MNTTTPSASSDTPEARPTKATKAASHARDARPRPQRSPRASRPRKPVEEQSVFSSFPQLDKETLLELPEASAHAIRKIVKEQPIAALLGAFGVGFLLGGGWRTRLGRAVALAAVRQVALDAAKKYYNP